MLEHEELFSTAELRRVISDVGEKLTDEEVDVAHLSATDFEKSTTIKF